MWLARAFSYDGEAAQALAQCEKAIQLFEEIDRLDKVARQCINVGNIHANIGDYTKALNYYQQAESLAAVSGDSFALNGAILNISTVMHDQQNIAGELEYHIKVNIGIR